MSEKSKSGQGIWLLRLVVLAVVFAAGWFAAMARLNRHEKETLTAEASSESRDASRVSVTAEPISHRSVQRTVEALGTLHGFEEVTISARIEGRVRKFLHDVGDRVKPDELLLEIDPTDFDLSVQQSDRALQVELAKLGLKEPPDAKLDLSKVPFVVKAMSQLEHAKSRFDRISRLAATKNVSAEESESAAAEYRTAVAEYDHQIIQAETGLATIRMKQVDLLVARENLANTKVHVPIPAVALPNSGDITYVVSQRSVSEGTLVRPGTEIFRVVISQILKLRVPVPERYSSEIKQDQQVHVFTSTSSTTHAGTVTRISPTVDVNTRTFQVEIQVPNANSDLKPGGFAKAAILTRIDPNATTVPLPALVQFAGVTKIFVVENENAKEFPVTLGMQTTDWVEIANPPLPENALVITSGQMAIANDTPVKVRDTSQPDAKAKAATLPQAAAGGAQAAGTHSTQGTRE